MNLRHWYAGFALQGILAARADRGGGQFAASVRAEEAIAHADALIEKLGCEPRQLVSVIIVDGGKIAPQGGGE